MVFIAQGRGGNRKLGAFGDDQRAGGGLVFYLFPNHPSALFIGALSK